MNSKPWLLLSCPCSLTAGLLRHFDHPPRPAAPAVPAPGPRQRPAATPRP